MTITLLVLFGILLIIGVFLITGASLYLAARILKIGNISFKYALKIGLIVGFAGTIVEVVSFFLHLGRLGNLIGTIVAVGLLYALIEKRTTLSLWKAILLFVLSSLLSLVMAVPVVLVFHPYVEQPFVVSGDGMAPTYTEGDYLIIESWDKTPKKGDVVIAKDPPFFTTPSYAIKRVVGLPGDTVGTTTVPAASYYLAGDNPSSAQGVVTANSIVGKVVIRVLRGYGGTKN